MAPGAEDSSPYLPSDGSDDGLEAAATTLRSLRSRASTRMDDPFNLRDCHQSEKSQLLRRVMEDCYSCQDKWHAVRTTCSIEFGQGSKSVSPALEAELIKVTLQAAARTEPSSDQHEYLLGILLTARSNTVCQEIISLWRAGKDLTLDTRTANKRWENLNTLVAYLVRQRPDTYREVLLPGLRDTANDIQATRFAVDFTVHMLKLESPPPPEAMQ